MTQKIEVTSPYSGEVIGAVDVVDAQQCEAMLVTALNTFQDRNNWLPVHERISIINKLADLVSQEQDDFAKLIAKEGGKPLTDAKIEVARAIDGIHLAAKELMHVMRGEEIPMGHTRASENRIAFTTQEPIGVVVAVSAFNHPLNLIVHQVVPAIAVGAPVIVKPASSTPLNCQRFVELVHQAGLPKAWCQFCPCQNEVAQKLVTDNRIAFFSFIGSAKVGWWLRSQLAPGVRCALEHGGVAPVIVDETADLDKAMPALLKGGFYHAGQVCVSVQRIYAHKAIIDELSKRLTQGAAKLKVGDPLEAATEVGPLISHAEVNRVAEWVQQAIDAGATCLTGGEKLTDSMYAPTVLLNPPEDAQVSTSEVFGPVVCLYGYDDIHDAIQRANGLNVAFQSAIFTQDITRAHQVAKQLDATAVMINDHTAFRVDWMPFGGRKHSGYGIGGIGYTMHDMLQPKMIVLNSN